MAATELRNRPDAAAVEVRKLNETATRQVSEILEESDQQKRAGKPALVYRVPSPGVRYYF